MNKRASTTDWGMWVTYVLESGHRLQHQVDILLSIVFNKHGVDLIGGSVLFGLRSGELSLHPKNAIIPLRDRWPKMPLLPVIEVKRSVTLGTQSKDVLQRSVTPAATLATGEPRASIGTSFGSTTEQQDSSTINNEFLHAEWQITWKGHERCAFWHFEVKVDDYLCGYVDRQRLCALFSDLDDFSVNAMFHICPKDIRILDVTGLWPDRICANKKGIIRALVRKFIANRMTSEMPDVTLTFSR